MSVFTRVCRRAGAAVAATAVVVPLSVVLAGPASAGPSACTARTGTYQRQVEKALGLPVDGRQSTADCRAIRTYQQEHGIRPAAGYAGPVTHRALQRTGTEGECPTDVGRIACVDLGRQVSWIQDGAKRIHGPVAIRSGRDGFETRTGLHKVYYRAKNHWSTLYDVAMPYSQFFDGGIAFHAIDGAITSPPGSHGCVNMRPEDAQAYWGLLHTGDEVYVYGRKPGT
ncbi:L,D-transpeptidase family protein [Embleya scabrispora]|uniref:L,D-transpeptidase family protein n=1 Tax=Embleya scabrispora TaxID=159449 RepID=UPI0003A442AF|nr:L,D-transpeptidase family protein [Embleya scabrispora]MYS83052.1 L,D-transpeptidase family protein [Streptomyces sp. SID5474]